MMIPKPFFLLTAILFNLATLSNALAAIHQYAIQKNDLTELNFPISFPQLYFFNGKGEIFYVTGGGRGDAVSDLKTFATGLDEQKISRMSQRPAVADHALWSNRFKSLAKRVIPARPSLFQDQAKVTLIGLILDPLDYPRCRPCKALIEEMRALADKEGLSLSLIAQKRP